MAAVLAAPAPGRAEAVDGAGGTPTRPAAGGAPFRVDPFDELLVPLDAPPEERAHLAAELVAGGEAALEAGEHLPAARQLEAAYRLTGDDRVLYPLARALASLGHVEAAEERLARHVAEAQGLTTEERAAAEAELAALRARFARVTFETDPIGASVYVDDELVGETPMSDPIVLTRGHFRVEARLEGFTAAARDLEVVGGEPMVVRLSLEAVEAIPVVRRSVGLDAALWTVVALAAGCAAGTLVAGTLAWVRYDRLTTDLEYRSGSAGEAEYLEALYATYGLAGATAATAVAAVVIAIVRAMGPAPARRTSAGVVAPGLALSLDQALAPIAPPSLF